MHPKHTDVPDERSSASEMVSWCLHTADLDAAAVTAVEVAT